MDKNINIAPKEIAPGVFSTGGVATMPTVNPIQPNVITPGALAPQTPINLAGTTPAPIVDTSLVANATQGTQAFDTNAEFQRQLELQKQTTPDQTPLNDILASLTASEQGLTGRGNEQLNAETSAGIPEAQKTRATLQGTIKSQLAEYEALKTEFEKMSADIEAGAGRKGLTTGAVMGQQGAVDRAKLARLNSKASEIGLLQAQDQALAGQIETAQNTVNRAIDLKYQDKEAEYQIKKLQYDRIKDSLTAEEKKRGEAMQNALKKEETALAETKANEKAIEKMLLDATPNAPANIIASANAVKQRGGSALEVAQALGKYGGDYLKTEMLKEQIKTEKAQQANIYNTISARNADTIRQDNAAKGINNGTLKQEDIAKAIESKVGVKTIAVKGLVSELENLKSLYAKYGARPVTAEGIGAIQSARSSAQLAITAAFGQGAISADDRTNYEKITGSSLSVNPTANLNQALETQKKNYTNNLNLLNTAYPGVDKLETFGGATTTTINPADNKFGQSLGVQAPVDYTTTNMSVGSDGALVWKLPTNNSTK